MSIASSLTGALKFDGVSSYSKTTYSTLYALIASFVDTTFDVDANNFFLPDPADRVLGIAGSGKTLFSSLGADTIALLEANIPAHVHQQYTNDNVNDVNNVSSTTSPAWKRSAGVQSVNYETESGTGEATRGKTSTVGSGTAFSIEQKSFIAAQYLYIYY
jgi:microcystin-dependent protein